MTNLRYKAFISYNHQDESWGKWLQRALEGYRIPRRLVGQDGEFGKIPARLSPVFRDREDLSSGADLSGTVKVELAQSESLIVICSPAAAGSQWVNKEISHFQSLGRGNRIYALIVDGDPQSTDPAQSCFPAALVNKPDGTTLEPLAADARKWTDGKHFAKLKLISGILGIRLDDLRRRDMQRRHRLWMVSTVGAMTVAIVTTVLAIMAVTARTAAENRRDHAENLVGYMVGDLRSKLDEVGRLDILEGMGGQVSAYLDTLDPAEVTDESLAQQARVWRQLGEVSMDQGDLGAAMTAFTGSRDVLAELHNRSPGSPEWIYQLGNAEFWIAYVFIESGGFEEAEIALRKYMDYAVQLTRIDPGNPEWLMEKGYAHSNLAALVVRQNSADVDSALEHIRSAVEINEQVLQLAPDNNQYLSEYGEALAWLADTQLMVCDLGGALISRQKSIAIARPQMQQAVSNFNLKSRYAYSLVGLSFVEKQVGLVDSATDHLAESKEILGLLSATDSSNIDIRWSYLSREYELAVLQADSGALVNAVSRFEAVYQPLSDLLDSELRENVRRVEQWNRYLLKFSDIAWRAGRVETAREMLMQAITQIQSYLHNEALFSAYRDELMLARFLYWQQTDQDLLDTDGFSGIEIELRSDRQSCTDIAHMVRQAIVVNDLIAARTFTAILLEKGYFEPGFISICKKYELCNQSD